jgi:hypothetical protein
MDAAEYKHVGPHAEMAPHRSTLTDEPYDDDEILNFLDNDITELQQDLREEVTFDSWLVEMISWGRFYPEENADAR